MSKNVTSTSKNFLLTTKNDSAIFSCKQRTNAMNRTKHHKLHAFQRAVGWCETVCNLCCYPLRAVYRKLLKRVSITGFPVIENLIADSDIKDRTERSPQAGKQSGIAEVSDFRLSMYEKYIRGRGLFLLPLPYHTI